MTFRELVARGLLLVAGSMVALGMGEALLRVGQPEEDAREFVAFRKSRIPGLDYEFVPGARLRWGDRDIRTNQQGFRGPEFANVPGVSPRIAVIGDSIAAGYGVAEDEAFPYRLAALMREQGLPGEVRGFGIPGYNIQRIVVLWEKKVKPYRPDAVVYLMCLNDARPELTLDSHGVLVASHTIELGPERARPWRLPLPSKDWLRERSLFYRFAMARYDLLLRRVGFRPEPLPPLEEVARLYSGTPEALRFRDLLARLASSVQRAGARFVVVCMPLGDQLRSHDVRPQGALRASTRALGLEFLDLYPAFLAAGGGQPQKLMAADGVHPNAAGHAVAALEVLAALRPWIADGVARRSACGSHVP